MIKEDKNFKTMVTPGFRPDEMFALKHLSFITSLKNYKKM